MSALKTVFITGASRGIGHATAKYFVDEGWRAITCSRDPVPPECARSDRHSHITADFGQVVSVFSFQGRRIVAVKDYPSMEAAQAAIVGQSPAPADRWWHRWWRRWRPGWAVDRRRWSTQQ